MIKRAIIAAIVALGIGAAAPALAQPDPGPTPEWVTDAGAADMGAAPAAAQDAGAAATADEPADTVPGEVTDETALSTTAKLLRLLRAKEWMPAVGAMMLLIAYFVRRFLIVWFDWFETRWGGLVVAFGIPLMVEVGLTLSDSDLSGLPAAIVSALVTGLVASGLWANRPAKFGNAKG